MIPSSVVTLLAFLLLVAPGLLFELLRERRRPALEETAFREASRIALASLVFTGLALLVLAALRAVRPEWLPDPGQWLASGKPYLAEHYRVIGAAVVLEVVLALGFAAIADQILRRRATGHVVPRSIWYQLLRADRPRGKRPWVSLCLEDGTQIAGYVAYYSSGEELDQREIALTQSADGTGMKLQPPEASAAVQRLDDWAHVVVRGDQIRYWKLAYRDGVAEPERAHWWSRKTTPALPAPQHGTVPPADRAPVPAAQPAASQEDMQPAGAVAGEGSDTQH